jgi:hypothetical protein
MHQLKKDILALIPITKGTDAYSLAMQRVRKDVINYFKNKSRGKICK